MTLSRALTLSASTSADRDTPKILKPTEAQLRYAQFHHKRRAQAVKHRIDRLHQTPLDLVIAIGKIKNAQLSLSLSPDNSRRISYDSNDDGGYSSVATEETSDAELKAIRQRRPKISAGRRGFLKDSKRLYRRRRRDIETGGYRGYFLDDDVNDEAKQGEETEGEFASDVDEHTDNDTDNYHESQHQHQHNAGIEEGDAAARNQIFATRPRQQTKYRRRRKRGNNGNGKGNGNGSHTGSGNSSSNQNESYQRFQAACHAMMRNIQTSQSQRTLPSIEAPSKKWRRSKAHVEASRNSNSTDFSRYRTSGFFGGRHASASSKKPSGKNATLLLSYKYYQQNSKEFVMMDRGASWLTHMPAKQSKRSKSNYYFHDMNELPLHLMIQNASSFDNTNTNNNNNSDAQYSIDGNGDGNESISSLAMRKPGPQKFHRLMAYVQHKLIEKQKHEQSKSPAQVQLLLLDGSPGIGQSRTRELAEPFQPPTPNSGSFAGSGTPGKIQQMADSIEGKNGTPTMKLKSHTPFSGLSSSCTPGSRNRNRKRKGKSRYVPRMRLRDFVVEGNEDDGDVPTPLPRTKLSERFLAGNSGEKAEELEYEYDEDKNNLYESSSSTPPKMRLRDSILGHESASQPQTGSSAAGRMSTDRTREMALAFEGDNGTGDLSSSFREHNHSSSSSKIQQLRRSLEPNTNDGTPKMKLKGDFDRIHDEHEAGDHNGNNNTNTQNNAISRSSVDRLSRQFQQQQQSQYQQSPPAEELEDFNRQLDESNNAGGPPQELVNEFSKHIDPRIIQQFEQQEMQERLASPSKGRGSYDNKKSKANNKRQSTGSNVSEFFSRIRGEQQERQQQDHHQQQPGDISSSNNNHNDSNHYNQKSNAPMDSIVHPPSPGGQSAISDLSRGSNISGFWNRGRSSISTLTSNLNTIAESQTQKGKGLLSPEVLGRATSGLFSKFRGVPEETTAHDHGRSSSLQQSQSQSQSHAASKHNDIPEQYQQQQQQQQQQYDHGQKNDMSPHQFESSQSIDSHQALYEYRQKRASMSPVDRDNMSEASSHHALPDQIRDVVQNSGGSKKTQHPQQKQPQEPKFNSPNRASVVTQSTLSPSELSAEQYKRAHGRFLEKSGLLGNEFDHDMIIDTDETQSDASNAHAGMDPQVLARLMMSPDMLQKRLKQAVASVERQKWDQVLFLINANPWLAEMKELTTNQYLLHKLAFFGTGATPAPMSLSEQLVDKFPAAVHKFDQDGNVPLHLAAAAGNIDMILMLGDKFASGASIRNEDGMLPLHFAIASFTDFDDRNYHSGGDGGDNNNNNNNNIPLAVIKTVLKLFPQAVAIADNDGNLPLHVASECLQGGVGVDVVYLLMDEAERQIEDPYGARFRNKVKMEDMLHDDDMSQGTMSTHNKGADDSSMMDTELRCTMVLNDFNETPLLAAIRSCKSWEMIEALVSGPGGRKAALQQDSEKNNALHLLVGEFQDATAAMSILKIVPETAFHRNAEGILPIEMACMIMMPEEVILAIALVDLPINIDDRDGIKVIRDRGGSWSFLTCDCDDHMVHVVEEILSICSFQQLQELCFLKERGSEQTIIDKATPKCREAMNRSLRFLGRFEFIGDGPIFSDMQTGFKAFDALDFGGNEEGKPVLLECYQNESDFENRVYTMFEVDLESRFVEEVNVYVEHGDDVVASGDGIQEEDPQQQQQRCVAIEQPRLKLNEVVRRMAKNGGYDSSNPEKRLKYSAKICSVLKLIGKALRHLHEAGAVHGNICMESCGKFEDSSWKLLERLGVQDIGKPFDPARFLHSFPPESLEPLSADNDPEERDGSTVFDSDRPLVSFSNDIVADVSIDIWAFGKICYESLVGKPLIDFDTNSSESPSDDIVALLQTAEWNVSNMEMVFADLLESGIDESGADMITACLFPSPADRPANMDEILDNSFWQEIRKHRSPRKGRDRRSGESVSTSVSLLTDVDRYEV